MTAPIVTTIVNSKRSIPYSSTVVVENARKKERADQAAAPLYLPTNDRLALYRAILEEAPGVGVAAQEWRMLRALGTGKITTLDARDRLDVQCPASRVLALRRLGYDIATRWVMQATLAAGALHRFSEYALVEQGAAE